jgi:hypothetical protein
MLESIRGIEKAIAGKTFCDYERSWVLRSALERGIEVISEASRHLGLARADSLSLLTGCLPLRSSARLPMHPMSLHKTPRFLACIARATPINSPAT